MTTFVRVASRGGSSGIGHAVVRLLLDEADTQVFCIARTEGDAPDDPRLRFIATDVSDPAQCRASAARVLQETGAVQGLVNSAGIICGGGVETTRWDEWNEVMQVNVGGILNATQAFLPLVRQGTGRAIVNVSSVCSLRPCDALAYSVSKAGVDMLTRCMAAELASERIREPVNELEIGNRPSGREGREGNTRRLISWSICGRALHMGAGGSKPQ